MAWFSGDVLSVVMIFQHYLAKLRHIPMQDADYEAMASLVLQKNANREIEDDGTSPALQVPSDIAAIFAPLLTPDGLVVKCLGFADSRLEHVMDFTRMRALSSRSAFFKQAVRNVLLYNNALPDFPMQSDQLESDLGHFIRDSTTMPLPAGSLPIVDYEVNLSGEWCLWSNKAPVMEVET
ncbi:hypothetical protein HAZT_HAZT010257 [Hyalella azteca]|uniref:Uncharacterized protein n=1 Tax=Hyalella azteca TaxID=294128 RepID=A0A6A0GYN2_HYAAZ|nr:hypothetical protein HAZT_HAZT010257 [Hyalella azteca]